MSKVTTNALLESLKSKDPKVYDLFRELDSRVSSIEGADPTDFLELLNGLLVPRTYRPVITAVTTNPTLGNSTLTGGWVKIGPVVFFRLTYTYGNAGVAVGNGTYFITLPYEAMDIDWSASMSLATAAAFYNGVAAPQDTTKLAFIAVNDTFNGLITHNAPVAWAAGATLKAWGWYFVKAKAS